MSEMSRPVATVDRDRLGRYRARLRRFVDVPFRRETYRNLAYLLLAFPLGLAYFLFVTIGTVLGLGLLILLVGAGILAGTVAIGLVAVEFERWLTARLLAVDLEARTDVPGDRTRDRLKEFLTDRKTWSALLYLPSKFLLGLASFVLVTTGLSTAMSMVLVPFYYDTPGLYVGLVPSRAPEFHPTLYVGWNYLLVGIDTVITVGYWRITTLSQALVVAALGIGLFLGVLHALNGLARLWRKFARVMLAGGYDPFTVGR